MAAQSPLGPKPCKEPKFNRYFIVGVGGNYRQTFSADTIPKLAPEVLGYKALASYDLFHNFFAYSEFDRNSPGMKIEENKLSRIWRNAAFAGRCGFIQKLK